jgi:hypothetical protein
MKINNEKQAKQYILLVILRGQGVKINMSTFPLN